MTDNTIRFIRRGELVALGNVPPERTLLEVLREDLGATGTKEGCGEGDCGACTVVLGELRAGAIEYRAINSCIRLAHAIDGMALWTVEDIARDDGGLHPAQEAMVTCHGSQCGFCTPGFVMSLFGMYQNHIAPTLPTACGSLPPEGAAPPWGGPAAGRAPAISGVPNPITRALAQEELSGNLCRCTGYRPIIDAAQQMASLPPAAVDERALIAQLAQIAPSTAADTAYLLPTDLKALLAARAAHPKAQIVAGCTDVGLWVTKMHLQFPEVLDLTRVEELRHVQRDAGRLRIGAAATLTEAYAALVAEWPQLKTFANRFAGLPVRNSGTLGGNVANGSPIGDSMPLLIALGASVVLASTRGEREMALEDFYTGYRMNLLAADEVLAWILVPLAGTAAQANGERLLRAYKISKRFDDDISAVCLVLNLRLEEGRVVRASIGAGGVAATPARARQTEAYLLGKPWTQDTVRGAIDVLRAEFQPITDMRASAAYRSEVLGNLLQRFWLESQGHAQVNLESPGFAVQDSPRPRAPAAGSAAAGAPEPGPASSEGGRS